MAKLRPLGDKILVKRVEAESKTKSGIVLPDTAKEKPKRGKVLGRRRRQAPRQRRARPVQRQEGRRSHLRLLRRHRNQARRRRADDHERGRRPRRGRVKIRSTAAFVTHYALRTLPPVETA